MADIIQLRRDTAARWKQYNPILLEGEVGYVTDNPNQYKIGDGKTPWNSLPLRGYTGTITQETGSDENAVMSQKVVTEKLSELGAKVGGKYIKNHYVYSGTASDAKPNRFKALIEKDWKFHLKVNSAANVLKNFRFTVWYLDGTSEDLNTNCSLNTLYEWTATKGIEYVGIGYVSSNAIESGDIEIIVEGGLVSRVEILEDKTEMLTGKTEALSISNDTKTDYSELGGVYPSGALTSSSKIRRYIYKNNNYKSLNCKVYSNSDFVIVAFYNSEEISEGSFMAEDSIFATSNKTYELKDVEIPEGCVTIVISNRIENIPDPTIQLISKDLSFVYGELKKLDDKLDKSFGKIIDIDSVDEIKKGYSIYYDSGNRTSSSTQTLYKIRNFGYSKLKCTLNSNSSTFAAVAFYKSDDIDGSMYDKENSVVSISARSVYEVNVPEDCKLIVVTNKSGTYEPIIEVYAKNIENVIKKHNAEFNRISGVIGFNTDNIIDLNYPLTMPTLLNSIQSSKTDERLSVENLVIAHCSDVHGQSDNLLRFVEFVDKYKEYIDDSICTGDMLFNVWSDDFNYWSECGGDNILLTIGNHETAIESNIWSGATHQDVYERFISPFVKNWGVVHEEGNTWYYKDYTSQKIRMIVIDPYYEQETQVTWFESVLSDAITNKLSVVVFEHNPFQSYNPIECSFNSLFRMGEGSLGSMIVPYMDKIEIFAANGGEFICWVCGHMHKDAVGTHSDYPNQMMVAVPATKIKESNNEDERIVGTKSQDCFNIISFDVTHKCVKVIRIGSDTDSCLRNRGTLCVNYLTKKILWNN